MWKCFVVGNWLIQDWAMFCRLAFSSYRPGRVDSGSPLKTTPSLRGQDGLYDEDEDAEAGTSPECAE